MLKLTTLLLAPLFIPTMRRSLNKTHLKPEATYLPCFKDLYANSEHIAYIAIDRRKWTWNTGAANCEASL